MDEQIRFRSSGLFGRMEDAAAAALVAVKDLGLKVTLARQGEIRYLVSAEETMPKLIFQVSLSPFEIIVGENFGLLLDRTELPPT